LKDVIIELTHPQASDENIPIWKDYSADVVIGRYGYNKARLEILKNWWRKLETIRLMVPNFLSELH
jgi:dihydrodipicolinate reductase